MNTRIVISLAFALALLLGASASIVDLAMLYTGAATPAPLSAAVAAFGAASSFVLMLFALSDGLAQALSGTGWASAAAGKPSVLSGVPAHRYPMRG